MSLLSGRANWLLVSCIVALVALSGCERLGFETQKAPDPPPEDTAEQPEPAPWDNPPEGWESPETELLVYEIGEDDVDEGDDQADAETPATEASETFDARVVVTADALHLENISALKLRMPSERETLAKTAEAAGLDTIWQSERIDYVDGGLPSDQREGVFKLTAVSDYMTHLAKMSGSESRPPRVALDLHKDAPYSRLYSVVYSIWDAAPDAKILVRARRDAADGPVFVIARATTRTDNLGECDPTEDPCARPRVEARDQGLHVRAVPGMPKAVEAAATAAPGEPDAGDSQTSFPCLPGQESAREGELPRFEPGSDWTNRVMLLDEALCPSVPMGDDSEFDAAGLVELFNDVEAMAPGCHRASWTAGMETPWRALGPAMGHAAAQTSFDEIQFERPLPASTPEPKCEDAMRPSPEADR